MDSVAPGMRTSPGGSIMDEFRHPAVGARAFHLQREGGEVATQTLGKGTRITGTARTKLANDLKKKYEKGQSIRDLAESTGRSYGFVHRLLVDADVTLRGRGGATRTKKK
jgi:hypothetical protein